jgi:uncharacterized protein with HEPN domain
MTSKKRNYRIYLEDIHLSMTRIIEYVGDMSFDSFKQNHLIIDAVVRNFEIIGEASKNIPDQIKEKYPEIPWKKMYSLRNLMSHEYFGIDFEMIWEIITSDLPQNIKDMSKILDAE